MWERHSLLNCCPSAEFWYTVVIRVSSLTPRGRKLLEMIGMKPDEVWAASFKQHNSGKYVVRPPHHATDSFATRGQETAVCGDSGALFYTQGEDQEGEHGAC